MRQTIAKTSLYVASMLNTVRHVHLVEVFSLYPGSFTDILEKKNEITELPRLYETLSHLKRILYMIEIESYTHVCSF